MNQVIFALAVFAVVLGIALGVGRLTHGSVCVPNSPLPWLWCPK